MLVCVDVVSVFLREINCINCINCVNCINCQGLVLLWYTERLADVHAVFLSFQLFIISLVIILSFAVMGGGVERVGRGWGH